jgi:hypothetical protein
MAEPVSRTGFSFVKHHDCDKCYIISLVVSSKAIK